MTEPTDVVRDVYALSDEAFTLAKEAAASGQSSESEARVQAIEGRLQELGAAVAEGNYDRSVTGALSEAAQDLAWVRSGGSRPMSMRLHYYLQDLRAQE